MRLQYVKFISNMMDGSRFVQKEELAERDATNKGLDWPGDAVCTADHSLKQ